MNEGQDGREGQEGQEGREGRDGQGRQVGRIGLVGRMGRVGRVGQVGQVARAMHVGRVAVVVLAFALLACGAAAADNARQIVEEAQKRTDVKSQRYEGLLQVFDAKGKISDKRWTMERLGAHGESKAVLRFTVPAEVKGVALLIVNHPDRASDQWMWTPAIERDRRIALQDRSTRFFGTDFSFEDLEERDVNQYEYALAGDDTVDGAACWKIASTPRESKSSQYTRSVVWIRKDTYAFARIENYVKDADGPAPELHGLPERSGDLDGQAAGDERSAPRQPHAADARQARIQRRVEGRELHAPGHSSTVTERKGRRGRTGGNRGRGGNGGRGGKGRNVVVAFVAFLSAVPLVSAQTVTQRGFVDAAVRLFPQEAVNDPTRTVGDILAREELFAKPAPWIQFAGGLEFRANSHDQVDNRWRIDLDDRGALRPRLSLRRLTATLTHGPLTVDVGKQFIRWGKADIVNPTDRFAPRDYMNVFDAEFLAVSGVRAVAQHGDDTFEAVWVPRFTPSRVPRLDQRWTVPPEAAADIPLIDAGAVFPEGAQTGLRWNHTGAGYEFSASFFNGFNHLPNVDGDDIQRRNRRTRGKIKRRGFSGFSVDCRPSIVPRNPHLRRRRRGADEVVHDQRRGGVFHLTRRRRPVRQSGAAAAADEYVLYVLQIERQTGEWVLVAGYAGEAVTAHRAALTFAPDRGLARSIVARASYTIDPLRSLAFETAIRQNGDGVYAKVEYSQARGQHWRATLAAIGIGGDPLDFLGQYRRNSHFTAALRYSF